MFGRVARGQESRAPLAGDRQETMQRLQVGFLGLLAMILLVGLANVIMNSVRESQATAVPEAAPTVVASEEPPQARDPLADAGVVPDLPAEGAPADAAATSSTGSAPLVVAPATPSGNGTTIPQP